MKVKSFFQDVLGSARVAKRRKEVVKKASDAPFLDDPISDVANALHPGKIDVELFRIKEISNTLRAFVFSSLNGHLPYFKAGQYCTFEIPQGKNVFTRPFFLVSGPYQTRGEFPLFEILVRKKEDFVSDFFFHKIKVKDVLKAEIGLGHFFFDPLRDCRNLVCLAKEDFVFPFLSFLKENEFGKKDYDLIILYEGNKDVLSYFNEYEKSKIISTCFEKDDFMNDLDLSKDATYFLCSDKESGERIVERLKEKEIPDRRIRTDLYPRIDLNELKDKDFKIKILCGIKEESILANGRETIATALEKAGKRIHTCCRKGECGCCRIKIEKGKYLTKTHDDQRRAADREFNYVYSCCTYPLSDLTIRIDID